jgi:hypothetical protein
VAGARTHFNLHKGMTDINLQIINRATVRRYSVSIADAMFSETAFSRGSVGEGDSRLIWFVVDGRNVIATNGDPVWEESDPEGFDSLMPLFV